MRVPVHLMVGNHASIEKVFCEEELEVLVVGLLVESDFLNRLQEVRVVSSASSFAVLLSFLCEFLNCAQSLNFDTT